jgi:hypothetical protein
MSDDRERDAGSASEESPGQKKHDCPDCTYCQWCSDDRCRLCRGEVRRPPCKPSMAEQILRYEALNRRQK